MRSRISILVVLVLILLSGCTSKEAKNKTPENKVPDKKTEDNKIPKPAKENQPLPFEINKIYYLGQSAEMDINGDEKKETITFEGDSSIVEEGEEHYVLTINGIEFKGGGVNIEWELMALSLDGKKLFFIVYENGPSGDPLSTFFQYNDNNGTIEEIGQIVDDIRNCELKDNEIVGLFRCDLIQTQFAYGSWKVNGEGKLEQVLSDEYVLYDDQYITTLTMDLPVHAEKDLSSAKSMITPQKIAFTKTDTKNWTYVEGVDGTVGWLYTNDFHEIEELGLDPWDVFADLVIYD